MMKQICVLFLVLAAMTAKAQVVKTITLDGHKSLSEALGEEWDKIDSIVVSGQIGSGDVETLRSCCIDGKLTGIDMSQAVLERDSLPEYAFNLAVHLKHVSLPKTLRVIGSFAFLRCYDLNQIAIPETVESLGIGVFSNSALTGSVVIPQRIKVLPPSTFYGCTHLKSVQLPSTLERIEAQAFSWTPLSEIEMPENLKYIGIGCFQFSHLEHLDIPDGVEEIGALAFNGTEMKRVKMPARLKEIPQMCFLRQPLESVDWPGDLESIGEEAFAYTKLTHIVLPEKVAIIWTNAFHTCKELKMVALPSSLKSMNETAFRNCPRLEKIYCNCVVPPQVFSGDPQVNGSRAAYHPSNTVLYVPTGSKDAYATSPYWREFSQIIETVNFPTAIAATEYPPVIQQASTWYRLDGSKGSPAHDYGRKSLRIADGRKVIK